MIKDLFPPAETLFLFIFDALFGYLLPLLLLLMVAREKEIKTQCASQLILGYNFSGI